MNKRKRSSLVRNAGRRGVHDEATEVISASAALEKALKQVPLKQKLKVSTPAPQEGEVILASLRLKLPNLKDGRSALEVCTYWQKAYAASSKSSVPGREGEATRTTAKNFSISAREVQKINKRWREIRATMQAWGLEVVHPKLKELEDLRKAAMLVQAAQYDDLIDDAMLLALGGGRSGMPPPYRPPGAAVFPYDKKMTADPESLRRFMLLFARAFARAHEGRLAAEQRAERAEVDGKRKGQRMEKALRELAAERRDRQLADDANALRPRGWRR